mmetsp:Transcript_4675/g.10061  ORF Transcript_4675/g.10061 Transcript_4675/m.10061 type:complete len:124 (-) Transcript_4675:276-647(-)
MALIIGTIASSMALFNHPPRRRRYNPKCTKRGSAHSRTGGGGGGGGRFVESGASQMGAQTFGEAATHDVRAASQMPAPLERDTHTAVRPRSGNSRNGFSTSTGSDSHRSAKRRVRNATLPQDF